MGNTLADYPLHYEDIPKQHKIKNTRKSGGKDNKMSKNNSTTSESKSSKKYNKTRGEHLKDLVIVALVVGIIAFGLGVKFQSDRNAEMQKAVTAATAVQADAEPVKK